MEFEGEFESHTTVQVDVVFRETLAEPDSRMSIEAADGGCVSVRVASPGQSLAWKLFWLESDIHAQGKDLFDAILLAERYPLPSAVLEATFRQEGMGATPGTASEFVSNLSADWDSFLLEYPWADGEEKQWLNRLEIAIGPTFGELGPADRGRQDLEPLDPSWFTTTVVEIAKGITVDQAWDRLPILSDALQEAGCDRVENVAHCLGNGPHARGCWVIDQILREQETV